jgi:small-conductance mechanosensitive channel
MSDEISLNKGWSLESYVASNESLRAADKDLQKERDLRYQERFTAQEKATDAALASAQAATNKAERAIEKRFDGVNEFREALSDQAARAELNASRQITRSEVEQMVKAIHEKVDSNAARVDKIEGRTSGVDASFAKVISLVGMAGVIVMIVAAILKWG